MKSGFATGTIPHCAVGALARLSAVMLSQNLHLGNPDRAEFCASNAVRMLRTWGLSGVKSRLMQGSSSLRPWIQGERVRVRGGKIRGRKGEKRYGRTWQGWTPMRGYSWGE